MKGDTWCGHISQTLKGCALVSDFVCVSSGLEGCRLRGRGQDFSLGMALVGTKNHLVQFLKPRIPLIKWVLMWPAGFLLICPPIPVCCHHN